MSPDLFLINPSLIKIKQIYTGSGANRAGATSHLWLSRRWDGQGATAPCARGSWAGGRAMALPGQRCFALPLSLPSRTDRQLPRWSEPKPAKLNSRPRQTEKEEVRHKDVGVSFSHFLSWLTLGAHGRGNKPQRWEEELPHGTARTFQVKVESGANRRSSW